MRSHGAPRTSRSADGGAPSLLNTIRGEHCEGPDAHELFCTSNGIEGATSAIEYEFVVAPRADGDYVERGGNFRALHPEWCRQAVPLPRLEARMRRLNKRLSDKGHVPLILEELIGGRL